MNRVSVAARNEVGTFGVPRRGCLALGSHAAAPRDDEASPRFVRRYGDDAFRRSGDAAYDSVGLRVVTTPRCLCDLQAMLSLCCCVALSLRLALNFSVWVLGQPGDSFAAGGLI